MKIKKNILLLSNNRLFSILIFLLFLVIAIIGYNRYNMVHSSIYQNLQGTYILELDSSSLSRSFDVTPLDFNMKIEGTDIALPLFDCVRAGKSDVNTYQDIDRIYKDGSGSWKTISANPDSIVIDAEFHFLKGKYQVLLASDTIGIIAHTITTYLHLDNDSTHLCFKKIR